jgi:hypothetical protein
MKWLFALIGFGLLFATQVRAQWTVYDPAVHTQTILNGAQEIAKFVEVVNKQVQQITVLTEQVNEFKKYEALFGNPSKVILNQVRPLIDDLRKTELGETLTSLQGTADAGQAMVHTARGLYRSVGAQFTTPGGKTVTRRREPYAAVAAVQKAMDNFLAVSTDIAARRVALKQQIAATTEQLRSATTDAEVQKLGAVLTGMSSALESTVHEIGQATASAVVQDIANRADAVRQIEAKKEQLHAEFTEATAKFAQTFRLLTAPATFPTH